MTLRIAFHSENGPVIGGSDVLMGVIAGQLPRDRFEIFALTRADYPLETVFRIPLPTRIGDATAANSGQSPAPLKGEDGPSSAVGSAGWKGMVRGLLPTAIRRRLGYWRSERRVANLLRRHQIQIFQTMDGGPQPTVVGAAAAGCSVVCVYAAPPPDGPPDRLTVRYSRRSAAAAGICVAMSRFTAAAWEQYLGWPAGSLRVIYNGVELPADPAAIRRVVRAKLGLAPDATVVGMTGRLNPEKGVLVFAAAAARLGREFPSAVFVITGSGPEEAEAKRIFASAGLTQRARFLGFRSDAPRIAAAYDVAAVPSVFAEPFGLVATEAMAAGVPVVASAVGGLPEVLDDGKAGVLVPPQDADALAEGIAGLLRDPARRRAVADAGVERVARHFTRQQMVGAYAALYDELLARAAQSRPAMVAGNTAEGRRAGIRAS